MYIRLDDRGQSLVEFAIILPILILLIMGIFDFGRVFHGYIVITNAAREGARLAAVRASDAEIITTVQNSTSSLNQNNLIVSVAPTEGYRKSGDTVTVTLLYRVRPITPILSAMVTDGVFELQAAISMRQE